MFRLSESDYKRLEPIALKVYRGSAKSPHVAQLMESRVGRRALVDMMFLEEEEKNTINENLDGAKRGVKSVLGKIWDFLNRDIKVSLEPKKREPVQEPVQEKRFWDKVKDFFSKVGNWISKLFTGAWDKIKDFFRWLYSLFFKESNLKSPKWVNIAIAVAIAVVIGYCIFGTSTGSKIVTFISNSLKAGLGAVKSAVRYVLGKSNAPQGIKNETEDFLDEATV
jgi:hypothetical protein